MDEDNNSSMGYGSSKPEAFVLPTAPRAARGPDMSDDRIPREPPFTAYIANLSYDVDNEVVRITVLWGVHILITTLILVDYS